MTVTKRRPRPTDYLDLVSGQIQDYASESRRFRKYLADLFGLDLRHNWDVTVEMIQAEPMLVGPKDEIVGVARCRSCGKKARGRSTFDNSLELMNKHGLVLNSKVIEEETTA